MDAADFVRIDVSLLDSVSCDSARSAAAAAAAAHPASE